MLQNSNMWNTAKVFFIYPRKEQYLLEISREINLAHTSVKKNLDILIKKGIITKTKITKQSRIFPVYKANIESKEFRRYKKLYNYMSITDSGLIEHLEETVMPKCIVLFGSYERGEDSEESDIDLFTETKETELKLDRFEKILSRKIQLHFNPNFKNYPTELKNNIANGTVLNGYLEAFK
jgi:predicted nucleotidyltransferase